MTSCPGFPDERPGGDKPRCSSTMGFDLFFEALLAKLNLLATQCNRSQQFWREKESNVRPLKEIRSIVHTVHPTPRQTP